MTFLPSVYIQFKEDNLRATKHGGHADRILDNLKPLNIKLYISNICILFSEAELLATVVVWGGGGEAPNIKSSTEQFNCYNC